MKPYYPSLPAQQSGFALIAALIILLVITLIGISGLDETVLEDRMVTNFRDRASADNAAESTVRNAEFWLSRQASKPDEMLSGDCSNPPLCGTGQDYIVWDDDQIISVSNTWRDMAWTDWSASGVVYEGTANDSSTLYGVTAQPRGLIEFRAYNPQGQSGMVEVMNVNQSSQGVGTYYYNVVGAGVGYRQETMAVVETTYAKWF